MRISRFKVLSEDTGIVHLFWRCHNKEFLLKPESMKKLFFKSLIFGLLHKNTTNSVKLHAFCFMDNHVHKQMSFENGAAKLSHFMRVANGLFGLLYNKANKRSGKVANERPKTPLIGDDESQMRVHFYIEANPLRAKKTTKNKLRFFRWCSYRFYAYGVIDEYTKHLTPPEWYIKLGKTPIERQRVYRGLFKSYLEQNLSLWGQFLNTFIGTVIWVNNQQERLRTLRQFLLSRNLECGILAPDPVPLPAG